MSGKPKDMHQPGSPTFEGAAAYEDYLDEDYFDGDEGPEFEFDCHLDPRSGQCGKAGSEECDWECPNRNGPYFAGNPGFRPIRKKHKPQPDPSLAGKFWWPSAEYSVPADNLCWHIPPSPNADYRCIRECGHKGRHKYDWSPKITSHSHKETR